MTATNATIIKYQDTALPVTGTPVTLFNSATAFPPGGSFHLLAQQWFIWSVRTTTTGGTGTGVITGSFSDDSGITWITFYTSTSIVDTTTFQDEVYVGMYKDVRFQLLMSTNNTLTFHANLALNPNKSASTRDATGPATGKLV